MTVTADFDFSAFPTLTGERVAADGRPVYLASRRRSPLLDELAARQSGIAGAIVVPAMPAFYQQPRTLDDIADFMAGKVLSVLGIPHALYPPWTGEVPAAQPAARR